MHRGTDWRTGDPRRTQCGAATLKGVGHAADVNAAGSAVSDKPVESDNPFVQRDFGCRRFLLAKH
jgi:hypothetical protein